MHLLLVLMARQLIQPYSWYFIKARKVYVSLRQEIPVACALMGSFLVSIIQLLCANNLSRMDLWSMFEKLCPKHREIYLLKMKRMALNIYRDGKSC